MSDLYLDLKRRIPVVAEWTDVGTDAMEEAQARTGLSDERLAREIPISAKTWVRWKRRGQIPTHLLPKVAPILGFEVVPISPIALPIETPNTVVTLDLRESLATVVDLLTRIAETVERNEDVLRHIERSTAAPARRQQSARLRS